MTVLAMRLQVEYAGPERRPRRADPRRRAPHATTRNRQHPDGNHLNAAQHPVPAEDSGWAGYYHGEHHCVHGHAGMCTFFAPPPSHTQKYTREDTQTKT
jgi:hypothetical protein